MTSPSTLDEKNHGCNAVIIQPKQQRSTRWKSRCKHLNLSLDLGRSVLHQALCGFVKVGEIGALHAATQDMFRYWVEGQQKKKCLKNVVSPRVDGDPWVYTANEKLGLKLESEKKDIDMAVFNILVSFFIHHATKLADNNRMLRFECGEREVVAERCWKQMASRAGKEAFQWGFAGGVYSGMTYGIQELRGVHDWKNAIVGGAITGAALSLTRGKLSMDCLVQGAITGGAVAMAAEILSTVPLHSC